MSFLNVQAERPTDLVPLGSLPHQVHVFSAESIEAVNAAIAANRPLLVTGEPGSGKSQLARAAAQKLKRAYVQYVMDVRTESRDLLWHFDAVGRLAHAQLARAKESSPDDVESQLAVENFLRPGPLWWAFDWQSAQSITRERSNFAPGTFAAEPDGWKPENGCVLLIDEIDKAEADVPNGLLEALGSMQFTPFGRITPVIPKPGVKPPLVIITTNRERALPDAFVRRCLVLPLTLPSTGVAGDQETEDAFVTWFSDRGNAHFKGVAEPVRREAARQLLLDRRQAEAEHQRPFPGQAEYLDLLRALDGLNPGDPEAQLDKLRKISGYLMQKHKSV